MESKVRGKQIRNRRLMFMQNKPARRYLPGVVAVLLASTEGVRSLVVLGGLASSSSVLKKSRTITHEEMLMTVSRLLKSTSMKR